MTINREGICPKNYPKKTRVFVYTVGSVCLCKMTYQRPLHLVYKKAGFRAKKRDFSKKPGFQPPTDEKPGFRGAPTVGAHRVHPEIPEICRGHPCGHFLPKTWMSAAHGGAHGKKHGFQGAHGGRPPWAPPEIQDFGLWAAEIQLFA